MSRVIPVRLGNINVPESVLPSSSSVDDKCGKDDDEQSFAEVVSLTVAQDVVEALKKWRPVLRKNKNKWHLRFALYQVRSSYVADDTGNLLLGAPNVLGCYGFPTHYRSSKVPTAQELLERYREKVDPDLKWTKWDKGRPRQMEQNGIPQHIHALHRAYLEADGYENAVFVPTRDERKCRQVDANSRKKRRDMRLRAAESYTPETNPPEEAARWQNYLNRRSPRVFSALLDQVPEARAFALEHMSGQKLEQALRKLKGIEVEPMPIYRFADYSVRLQTIGETLQGINSELRRKLYPENWVELDLAKAQLSIAEADWGELPVTRAFLLEALEGEINIWQDMIDYCRLVDVGSAKRVVKAGTYATLFGAGRNNVLWEMQKASDGKKMIKRSRVEPFLNHPIVCELMQERYVHDKTC